MMAKIAKVCIRLFMVLLFVAPGHAAINPGTVAGAWLFNEGSGTTAKDSSSNGKDGKIQGGAKWVQGKFGKALEFNGTDALVAVPNIGTFDEVTITAWVMTTGRTGQWRVIIDNNGWKAGDIHHQLAPNNQVEFSLNGNPGGNDQFGKFLFDNSQLNEWHHLATAYSSKERKVRFYVDGQLDVETAWGGNAGTLGPAWIGAWDGEVRYWQGVLDEIVIFNVILSVDDIKTVMDKGIKGITAVSPLDKLTTTWATVKTIF